MFERIKDFIYKYITYIVLVLAGVSATGYYGYQWYKESSKSNSTEPSVVANKEYYGIGDTVILKVKHNYKNITGTEVVWKVFDNYEERTDFTNISSDSIAFGTGNQEKQYLVLVSVCYIGTNYHKDYVVTTLVNIGAAPQPPPNPGPKPIPNDELKKIYNLIESLNKRVEALEKPIPPPPPPPSPAFPNEKHGLSTFIYHQFNKDYNFASLTIQDSRRLADKLAGVCDSYVASIAAGAAKDSETVLKDVNVANNRVLTELNIARANVLPFFNKLQDELKRVDNQVGLENIQNLKQALVELRDGFRSIK